MNKLTLMVCPHDTAKNPEKWYLFAQHLSKQLNMQIHFSQSLDFKNFHETLDDADIVYANPMDTIMLVDKMGFTSLARPEGIHDEVVFIANNEIEEPTLQMLQGKTLVTVKSMLATYVGLRVLDKEKIELAELLDRDSWLSVINAVRRRICDFGFLYKDTYDGLTNLSRSMFNAFFTTDERVVFHSITLNQKSVERKQDFVTLLLEMHENDKGKGILEQLEINKWLPVKQEDLGMTREVIETYS